MKVASESDSILLAGRVAQAAAMCAFICPPWRAQQLLFARSSQCKDVLPSCKVQLQADGRDSAPSDDGAQQLVLMLCSAAAVRMPC